LRQEGSDLGERLFRALSWGAGEAESVAAVGSDLPTLSAERVEEAFALLEAGGDVVLGPAADGGYYLIALRRSAVHSRLFAEIAWSTDQVLPTTLARCAELGLRALLLAPGADVDTPADLERLAGELAAGDCGCPRTRALLAAWGRLPRVEATA
jgi:glycosyltransferase A (GT-A) superfamily protein (DUF2064 family)